MLFGCMAETLNNWKCLGGYYPFVQCFLVDLIIFHLNESKCQGLFSGIRILDTLVGETKLIYMDTINNIHNYAVRMGQIIVT